MCPYKNIACPGCHVEDSYPGCARYKLATFRGIEIVPNDLGILDHGRVLEILKRILINVKNFMTNQ